MDFKSIAVLLVPFFVVANGQQFEMGGGCPAVASMTNFDMGKYQGKWYEVMKFPLLIDPTGKCSMQIFSPEFFWHKMEFKRTESIFNFPVSNTFTIIPGSFTPNLGTFLAVFFFQSYPIPIGYNIIDTDYTTYAIAGACLDLGVAKIKLAWVLARNSASATDQNFINTMTTKLMAKNMTTENMRTVNHSGCPAGYDLEEVVKS